MSWEALCLFCLTRDPSGLGHDLQIQDSSAGQAPVIFDITLGALIFIKARKESQILFCLLSGSDKETEPQAISLPLERPLSGEELASTRLPPTGQERGIHSLEIGFRGGSQAFLPGSRPGDRGAPGPRGQAPRSSAMWPWAGHFNSPALGASQLWRSLQAAHPGAAKDFLTGRRAVDGCPP